MSDGVMTLGLLVAALGAVACFFGYRVFIVVIVIGGFVAGGLTMSAVAALLTREDGWLVGAFLLGGFAAAIAAVKLYRVGVFLLGALIGVILAFVVIGVAPEPVAIIGFAVVLGITALVFEKFLVIASTSAAGALAIVAGAGFIMTNGGMDPLGLARAGFDLGSLMWSLSYASPVFFVAWFVVGVGGGVVQYRWHGDESGTLTRGARARGDRGATAKVDAEPSLVLHLSDSSQTLPSSGSAQSVPASQPTGPVAPKTPSAVEAPLPSPAPAAIPIPGPGPSPRASRAGASAPVTPKPLATFGNGADDPDEAIERLTARLKEARERFRHGLDVLREETLALTRSGDLVLASWTAPAWDGWGAASVAAGDVADRGVRVGDVNLFAGGEGEDMWTVPAVVAPAQLKAVFVEADSAESDRVRWAIVGWCLRLVAATGPGRVGVAWFEEGRAEGVPEVWRASADASLTTWFERRTSALAGEHPAGTRWVVVGMGLVADAVLEMGPWLDDHVAAGLAAGVSLWLAPSRQVEMASEHVVCLAMVRGRPGRFHVQGGALGRHEVRVQEPPPAELLERYAGWAVPPDVDARSGAVEPLEPVPASAENPTIAPAPANAGDSAAPPVPVVETLRSLLAAPVPATPRLVLGHDEDRRPVEFALDGPLRLRGGTPEEAAARLGSHLFEIACQTHASAWEFAVLDFSDDAGVADRFDAILDLTPHLIEYTEGVSAHVKLEDTLHRFDQPDPELPHLALLLLAHPTKPVPDGLERVLQDTADARVHPLVWQAASGPSGPSNRPGDVVVTLDVPSDLRVVGRPARRLQLAAPLTASEAASLAHTLQQARA